MRDQSDLHRGERNNIVVEALQREAMQVDEISRHVQLGELPLSAWQVLGACHPTFEQQHRLMEFLTMANERAVGRHLDNLADEAPDRLLFTRADVVPGAQLFQMNFDHERIPPPRSDDSPRLNEELTQINR